MLNFDITFQSGIKPRVGELSFLRRIEVQHSPPSAFLTSGDPSDGISVMDDRPLLDRRCKQIARLPSRRWSNEVVSCSATGHGLRY